MTHNHGRLVKALLRSPDPIQRHMGADAIDAILPHGKDRRPAPLVIPADISWAVDAGRDAVERDFLRESCLNHLGHDAMHTFLLRQLGPQLRDSLFEPLSHPGSVVARYNHRWGELDLIEVDADVSEQVFGIVAKHIDDEHGYVMDQRFIKRLPNVLKLCMASDRQLTSGLLLFIAANATVPQLPSIVEALQFARAKAKKNFSDLDGLARLIETKVLKSLRECIDGMPLSAPVAEALLDTALGRVALKTFKEISEAAGKKKMIAKKISSYNKNSLSKHFA